jgi:hypothetical protein
MDRRFAVLALAGAITAAEPASAGVSVSFANPAQFRDVDRAGGILRPGQALVEISRFLQRQGKRLPPGQDVEIRILDFNLAGVIDPIRPEARTTRLLGSATWPSARLRYVLRERGRVVAQAEELVADREYLGRALTSFASDPLRYEKNMLYDWFDARFILRQPPPPP